MQGKGLSSGRSEPPHVRDALQAVEPEVWTPLVSLRQRMDLHGGFYESTRCVLRQSVGPPYSGRTPAGRSEVQKFSEPSCPFVRGNPGLRVGISQRLCH